MTKFTNQPIFGWREAVLALVLVLAIAVVPAMAGLVLPVDDQQETVHAKMLQLPLSFIENKGQAPDEVKFHVAAAGHTISFTPDRIVLRTSQNENEMYRNTELAMTFPGALASPEIVGLNRLLGNANFFLGNDSSRWQNDVPMFGSIEYHQLYSGIDLVYEGTEGVLKREFVVAPCENPDQIAIAYDGIEGLSLTGDGSLAITTSLGVLTDQAPVAYQVINGAQVPVAVSYRIIDDETVGFKVGAYDPSRPLIIDPTLIYSSYFGGSTVSSTNTYIHRVLVDTADNIYIAGRSASISLPVQNANQGSLSGGYDAFVAKLNPGATSVLYLTYLGGTLDDSVQGLSLDSGGNIYLCGGTKSNDFPLQSPILTTRNSQSTGYFAKLNPSGSPGSQLVYSSLFGYNGTYNDTIYTGVSSIVPDTSGNAWISGYTRCDNLTVTADAAQPTFGGGGLDVYLGRIASDGSLSYLTYLGGSADEGDNAVADCSGAPKPMGLGLDSSGNVYLSGQTKSADFPVLNAYNSTFGGGNYYDLFAAKFTPTGSKVYATFIGGSNTEVAYDLAVDSAGAVYITGKTYSNNFPLVNPAQGTLKGTVDIFLTKLNAPGTALEYSTYWGGSSSASGDYGAFGIAIDGDDNAYLAGYTTTTDFPIVNGTQSTRKGSDEGFVAKFAPEGNPALYSTYIGGTNIDDLYDIAINNSGDMIVVGASSSPNYPIAGSLYQSTRTGTYSGVITIISPLSLPVANFTATPLTCPYPLTVQFTDLSTNDPTSWDWQFGDGSPNSTEENPSHSYTAAGLYTVNLTAINAAGSHTVSKANLINVTIPTPAISVVPNTTTLASGSTTQYQLVVTTLPAGLAGFNLTVSLDHPAIGEITAVSIPSWAALNGTSTLPADIASFNAVDLNKQVEPGATNVLLGTVTVRADTSGTTGINVTVRKMDDDNGDAILPVINNGQLQVFAPLVANFSAEPLSGYRPLTVNFTDLSTGSPTAWAWIFGDLTPEDTTQNPTHTYTAAGNYTVNLTASNAYNSDSEVKALYIQVQVLVLAFPGYTNLPTDPDGDGLYEDINGNGRLDFDDVVAYYSSMAWMSGNADVGTNPYDYNHNGRIDFDDVVVLYEEVLVW